MSSGLLGYLPHELIEKVFSYLSTEDCMSASYLNRSLHSIVKGSIEIQYTQDLQKYGMIDGGGTMSIAAKRSELVRMEEVWRTADISRRVSVKVRHNTSNIYDLSGGFYMLGDCRNSVRSRNTMSLRFFDLSSCETGCAVRDNRWPEMTIPDRIVDIGLALQEHDLVSIIALRSSVEGDEVILYFKQLSSGGDHPLADKPEMIVETANHRLRRLSIMAEIVGPCLMLLLTWSPLLFADDGEDILLLINWWTGEIVIREMVPSGVYNGFIFLSDELVLLPNSHTRVFEILKLPDLTKPTDTSSNKFHRIAGLGLPEVRNRFRIFNINCRSDPNPFGAPHPKARETGVYQQRRERPFSADPSCAIVLTQFLIREQVMPPDGVEGHWQWRRISLVFSRSTALKAIQAYMDSPQQQLNMMEGEDLEAAPQVVVPWEDWAPGKVRWFPVDDTHPVWITTTAGQRYIDLNRRGKMIYRDFNPYAVKHMRSTKEPHSLSQLFDESMSENDDADEDQVRLEEIFVEPADWCELPYIKTTPDISDTTGSVHSVMIDTERILRLNHNNEGHVIGFDVFSM